MSSADTERRYRRIAHFYDFLDRPFERKRYQPLRPALFEGLSGRILDTGIGTGCNMPFYPGGAVVVGIDLSEAMLRRALSRRERLNLNAPLACMDILRPAFPDGVFDSAVATFLFCVLAPEDQRPALVALKRIVKPGGEIRLLEYAYSRHPLRRLAQRLWSPWVRFAYGAAFDRETARHVPEAGLDIVEERFLYLDMIKLIVARVPPTR
jgi:demethylmenaquinone methyltransferase/2-methoxy-6-polyprenyl-1,4-benzoquinol methylase